eukprot:378689_1
MTLRLLLISLICGFGYFSGCFICRGPSTFIHYYICGRFVCEYIVHWTSFVINWIFLIYNMSSKKARHSKRKRNQVEAEEWDEEHVNKKHKTLCSGLLDFDTETIQHLKTYHYLFPTINFNELSLSSLQQHISRSDTFFFCGGEGIKICSKSGKCQQCIDGSSRIQSVYNIYDITNVKEVCRFLEASEKKAWKPLSISSSVDENNVAHFTLTIDQEYTKNRMVRFEISPDKFEIFDDRKTEPNKTSKAGTNIDCKYLLKTVGRTTGGVPNSMIFCGGITGYDWLDERTFGCNRKQTRWVSNAPNSLITHKLCKLVYKKQKGPIQKPRCIKCKSLKQVIDNMKVKGNYNKMPSKHTPAKDMNAKQREMKVDELRAENKKLKDELKAVNKELNDLRETFSISYFETDIEENHKFGKMIRYVLNNYNEIKNGMMNGYDTSKIDFVYDQFKIAQRKYEDYCNGMGPKKVYGIRWSVATKEFAQDIFTKGSGAYKTAHNSPAMELPSLSRVKETIMKYRHTNMSAIEWCDEVIYELIFRFGSIEEALKQVYDAAFDEVGVENDSSVNSSNFTLDGRAAYHVSDALLDNTRNSLYNAKNNLVDDLDGSKQMMVFVLRSSTSDFVWYGPHFGSAKGLTAIQIQAHFEDDFLLPLLLNVGIMITSIHLDMASAHQKYIRHKTGIAHQKELLGKAIKIFIKFYNCYVLVICDKDHCVKALRNAVTNCILYTPLKQAWNWDRKQTHPVLECHEETFNLNRFNKMNMKYIFDLFDMKTILSLKEINAI